MLQKHFDRCPIGANFFITLEFTRGSETFLSAILKSISEVDFHTPLTIFSVSYTVLSNILSILTQNFSPSEYISLDRFYCIALYLIVTDDAALM